MILPEGLRGGRRGAADLGQVLGRTGAPLPSSAVLPGLVPKVAFQKHLPDTLELGAGGLPPHAPALFHPALP